MQAMNAFPSHVPYTLHVRPLRILDDMDAFMNTFDQAVTVTEETFDKWAMRNDVDCRAVYEQDYLLITFLGLSTHMRSPYNRGDLLLASYELGCLFHGSEAGYLDWFSKLHLPIL